MPFIAILLLIVGLSIIVYPETWLRFEDLFRIRGEREYSGAAFMFMRIRGIIVTLGSIIFLFMSFQ